MAKIGTTLQVNNTFKHSTCTSISKKIKLRPTK